MNRINVSFTPWELEILAQAADRFAHAASYNKYTETTVRRMYDLVNRLRSSIAIQETP